MSGLFNTERRRRRTRRGRSAPGSWRHAVLVLRWMVTSLEIGGHRDDGTRDMLERCLADPTSTQLLRRLLRGDRSVATELRAYLLTHP